MPDPEVAARIEGSIARTLKYAAEELPNGPDRTASKLGQATTQLDSSDAKEHLSADTIAKFRVQIADLQTQVEAAERAEKAGRIERDVKRYLSNLEDEIRSNGSQIESYLDRATTRLTKDDVREALSPEMITALETQLAELRARATGSAAPAPPPPPAAQPIHASAPAPVAAPPVAASAPAAASAETSEEAQRVKGSISRTLRNAFGDIDSPGWRQVEGKISQAETQIQSDDATRLLTQQTLDDFRSQLKTLQEKFAANHRVEQIDESERWLQRLVRDAEQHTDWPDRIGGMLEKISETLDTDKVREYLPADRVAFYRGEVTRIESLAGGTQRQKAIDDASEPLAELESRVNASIFEGLSEYDAQKLWGDLERLQNKVGYALDRLPAGDAAGAELRARLDAVVARRAAAYEGTRRTDIMQRVVAAWNEALAKVAGWESETQDTSANALGGEFLPQTRSAMRALREVLGGSNLFSPIPDARSEFPNDPTIVKIVNEGERILGMGFAKLTSAFDAIMDAAENMPTPTGEFELRRASSMAQTARDAFDGTPHEAERVARATALDKHWEDTLELVRLETAAYYEKVSAVAAEAWPSIASAIKADDGFNPNEPTWHGKTVRINGLYNRMRWDFTGDYHMATWVRDVPVAADFEPWVLEAYNTAVKETRSSIDDHTLWDAIAIVEGKGKLKQRFKTEIKKNGLTVGELEEWLPVDCVTCKVIALRAGPVAVGPSV